MYRRRGYSATIDIGKYPVPETDQEEQQEQEQEHQSLCGLLLDLLKITLCCCFCRIVKHNDDDDYDSCDEMACAIGDSEDSDCNEDNEGNEDNEDNEGNDSGSDSSYIDARGCTSDSDYDD